MSTTDIDSFGSRVRHIRSVRGWSQAHLADLLGMAKAQLSRYEVGRSAPRAEVVVRIASVLGVSAKWLETGDVAINEDDFSDLPPGQTEVRTNLTDAQMKLLMERAEQNGRTLSEELEWITRQVLEQLGYLERKNE
ncbi:MULTISPECIES: helix-turn-helix transcriptional regulator [Pandoraea]|uniref:helix-turn-helix domain-containing protein n=1 Tax=Pandoraea TaxID=93217 RepID=UPI001F5D2A27|nr:MULTISPECIES: helix-turn-helix transcriptional regulator [Pandoraea]MCI3206540.1 hypothetical protein [Pandoraea sp. LA3]MDN4584568.1 hypothetical protein [Pandoraea capi]